MGADSLAKNAPKFDWTICPIGKFLTPGPLNDADVLNGCSLWGISANINPFFGLIITHSFTNSSTVVSRCHCRTTLPDSCLRLMVFQSRRSLFNSSNCKTSKSMMCEAPIQMSYNKHKLTLMFHRNTYCRLPSRNTCYNLES